MDKAAALACARRYAEEVTKELKPEKIVVFGSYATGQAHEDSDIDVAVIFNGFEGDFLRVSSIRPSSMVMLSLECPLLKEFCLND